MNNLMHQLRAASLVAALSLTVGCVTNEGPSRAENVSPVDVQLNTVNILSDSLHQTTNIFGGAKHRGKIEIDRTHVTTTGNGLPQVIVVIRNRSDHPLQVEGRTTWFDPAGIPVDGPSAWQRIFLPPNSVNSYQENSISNRATQYYVEIREGV